MTNLDSILKSKDITLPTKVCCQSSDFSSSHVWMWELDYKESWAPKNWCFPTVVLEKTLESPVDCKEIQPVDPKGNQSWIFIGRTDAEAETPILWPPDVKNWLIGKDPDAGKDWRQEEKGWVGWMASLTQWTWVWASSGSWVMYREAWRAAVQGGHKESDTTEQLNWTSLRLDNHLAHSFSSCRSKVTLVQIWKVKVKSLSRVRLCNSVDCTCQTPPSMDFPGKITGLGCHFLLQGISPNQGLNPGLLHCRQTLPSEPQGKLLGIFPIQGLKPGLPHCWWILYQLSHTWGIPWPPYWNWTPPLFYFCHRPLT